MEKSQAKSADEAVRAVLDGKSEIVNTEFSCIHKTSVKPESSISAVYFYNEEENEMIANEISPPGENEDSAWDDDWIDDDFDDDDDDDDDWVDEDDEDDNEAE